MRCEKCGREYPSIYYFKTDKVCLDCFNKMTPEEKKQAEYEHLIKYPMTSTTFTIEGHKIIRQLGVVRGITVRSRSIFGNIGAGIQTIFGGNITLYTDLCEKSRGEAFEMMMDHAMKVGANAVVGIRYDTTELLSGVTEVLCYGTAVITE